MSMPRNRCAEYFEKMARPTETTETAEQNGRMLHRYARTKFPKDKVLAERAELSPGKLSELFNKGFDREIPSLRQVCHVLGIDPQAACEGKIVELATGAAEPEIVRLARQLVGTDSGEQAANMLRHLVDLELRAGTHRNT